MNRKHLLDKFRAGPWLIGALIATCIVGWLYPHQLGVLLWSLSKLSLGAYLGYWIDRSIFRYARPGSIDWRDAGPHTAYLLAGCMLRRALIIAAAILALGLGV